MRLVRCLLRAWRCMQAVGERRHVQTEVVFAAVDGCTPLAQNIEPQVFVVSLVARVEDWEGVESFSMG